MGPRPRRVLALVAAGCLAAGLAASWAAGSVMVRGETSTVPPAVPPAREVRLRSTNGVVLAATYWPGSSRDAPAVLLLHGVGSSRRSTAPNATWLAARGYAALAVDFRGHGESSPSDRSFGLREAEDARAAFGWLKKEQRAAPVAVVGISMGGAAALLGPGGPLPADALVLQAVYPDVRRAIRNRIAERLGGAPAAVLEPLLSAQSWPRFGVAPSALSPLRAIERYSGPVMIIAGAKDRYTPPAETRALFHAAPGPKSLWIVPEGDHAAVCSMRDDGYQHRLADFLARTIGQPR